MTSKRPYRDPMQFPAALDEIVREAGRQFDPRVVAALDRTRQCQRADSVW